MLRLIEERLKERRRADAVRLEIAQQAADELVEMIVDQEELRDGSPRDPRCVQRGLSHSRATGPDRPDGIARLAGLRAAARPAFVPRIATGLRRHGEDIFSAISRRDILLHHPYDDFSPVVEFVQRAAQDPDVLAIKQTLYRTSGDSPIVQALTEAAEKGKHVTALVELQARFDEEANVGWARQLEQAGVHVVYGFMDLKTHCKVSLVVRQEDDVVKRYVHLGTGNYNPTTARLYTDLGLFTSDEDIGADASALFNLLTGYSQGYVWRKLVVAPTDLHRRTIELIDEQTELARRGKPSRIFAKLNSLVDHRVIDALYRASQAGVPIELVVRGICCLRPGIKGISENIQVDQHRRSLPGTQPDLRVRPGRDGQGVSRAAPIGCRATSIVAWRSCSRSKSPPLRKQILQELLPTFLRDNVRARQLQSDGTYVRVKPKRGEIAVPLAAGTAGARCAARAAIGAGPCGRAKWRRNHPLEQEDREVEVVLTQGHANKDTPTREQGRMMDRRLIVMRHAKSSWSDPAATDHERPLNDRGRHDAPRVAARLANCNGSPSGSSAAMPVGRGKPSRTCSTNCRPTCPCIIHRSCIMRESRPSDRKSRGCPTMSRR